MDGRPVIYIDLPEEAVSTSTGAIRTNIETVECTQVNSSETKEEPDQAVIYIDIPENEPLHHSVDSGIGGLTNDEGNTASIPGPQKREECDETPRIYIDLPEDNRQSTECGHESRRSFLQNTIYYDPFEDRRIDQPKDRPGQATSQGNDAASSSRSPTSRPTPPNTLNGLTFNTISSTSTGGSSPYRSPQFSPVMPPPGNFSLPQSPSDSLALHPLPVQDYRDPPPAYWDIDESPGANPAVISQQPVPTSEPRESRGTTATPIGIPDPRRKCVKCPNCHLMVHTLRVNHVGLLTHVAAFTCMVVCMFPILVAIYATPCCKYKHHYCPNCNKLIGFAYPCFTDNIIYRNP